LLTGCPIAALPPGLKVDGNLFIDSTAITTLPGDLQVGGNLYARHSRIERISADMAVAGSMDLAENPLKALPDDFSVQASLNLSGCPIAALPENLTRSPCRRHRPPRSAGLPDCQPPALPVRPDAIAIAPDAQLGGVVILTLDTGGSVPEARVMKTADYTPPSRLS
jgi:hypothetical protein